MSCGVGHRHSSDLVLLWLWCRLAATALIRPSAWEPPYAVRVALKRLKKKKERERERDAKNATSQLEGSQAEGLLSNSALFYAGLHLIR